MNQNRRDTVRLLVIVLLAMLVLPLGYRVWMWFNPRPEPDPSAPFLRVSDEFRREELLTMAPGRWTENDTKTAPDIRAWLEAHSSVVLPWEWTQDAIGKDRLGFFRLWERLVDEELSELKRIGERKRGMIKTADKGKERASVLRKHLEEQIETLTAVMATNSYPAKVVFDRLSPGRLFGWNHDDEEKEFPSEKAWKAFLGSLREESDGYAAQTAELGRRSAEMSAEVEEIEAARNGLEMSFDSLRKSVDLGSVGNGTDQALRKALLKAILAVHRYRESVRRNLPDWVPEGMKKALE